jgi:hypothetical protein
MKKKLVLGDEYDEALRHALMAALASLGANIEAHQWGLGGSQIIQTTKRGSAKTGSSSSPKRTSDCPCPAKRASSIAWRRC